MATQGTIGVIGLGLLGRGITACLLSHGFRVVAYTQGQEGFAQARSVIAQAMRELREHGKLTDQQAQEWAQNYVEAASFAEFAPCSFIIESVTEDLAIKQQAFNKIEEIVGPDVPIGSNTSALPITLLQRGRKYPDRFVGMHWAEPAYATRFLELIRGEHTSDAALEQAAQLGRYTGKDPCIVQKDVPAFIVNRLGYAMYREAAYLVETGVADVETVDRAFRNAMGLWATFCGPFRWMDLTGGPALYGKAMSGVLPSLSQATELPPFFQEKMQNGEQGVLDGRGFYHYTPEDRQRWETLLHEHAWAVQAMQDRYHPLEPNSPAASATEDSSPA